MKTISLKIFTSCIVSLFLFGCVSNYDGKGLNKRVETLEGKIRVIEEQNNKTGKLKARHNKSSYSNDQFKTLESSYGQDATYNRTVIIPQKKGFSTAAGSKDVTPKVVGTFDFSDSSKYIVFEVYSHGIKEYRWPMTFESTIDIVETSATAITNSIKGFDVKTKKPIYVFAFHDENLMGCSERNEILNKIKEFVQDGLMYCNSASPIKCIEEVNKELQNYLDMVLSRQFPCIADKNFSPTMIEPRTVGNGGVIPPRR